MILVDDREGSKDLLTPLRSAGVEAELCRLEFGDVAFAGKAAGGGSVDVGIEFKQVGEYVASLQTKRFQGHQAVGMSRMFDHRWLLVEGGYGTDKRGRLTIPSMRGSMRPVHGSMTTAEMEKQTLTLELKAGFRARFTQTRSQSIRFIVACYQWWNDAEFDAHKSHEAIYHPPTLVAISQFRQTISTLPGVGLKTSLHVERHFRYLAHAFRATEAEWRKIDGIGPVLAARIVSVIKGT